MWSLQSSEIFRNMGFWDNPTQDAILNARVAIGGTGGAGYLVAIELARIGVQRFAVADPEEFEWTNANRVIGVRRDTIGRNKAEVLAEEIAALNPGAEVQVYADGISAANVDAFVRGADVVLDATELSMPELGTMICRSARAHGAPVLNVEYVGHAGQGTSFSPTSSTTFERFMGIEGGEGASLDDVATQQLDPSRYLAYIPPYADLTTLAAVRTGAPLPSNMIGAGQAAQIGVAEAVKHIRQRAELPGLLPVVAPEVRWLDPYTGKAGRTSHPRVSYYRTLGVAVVRNRLGRYDRASYRPEERAERGDR
jgi:hypothetical protein